jgi:hypothetical protein
MCIHPYILQNGYMTWNAGSVSLGRPDICGSQIREEMSNSEGRRASGVTEGNRGCWNAELETWRKLRRRRADWEGDPNAD